MRPMTGVASLRTPRGARSHDHRICVPSGMGSKVSVPSISMFDNLLTDVIRPGLSYAVNSTLIAAVPRRASTCVRNRLPFPTGPGVTFSTVTVFGLNWGSFLSSATKSNTCSTGRLITISPT